MQAGEGAEGRHPRGPAGAAGRESHHLQVDSERRGEEDRTTGFGSTRSHPSPHNSLPGSGGAGGGKSLPLLALRESRDPPPGGGGGGRSPASSSGGGGGGANVGPKDEVRFMARELTLSLRRSPTRVGSAPAGDAPECDHRRPRSVGSGPAISSSIGGGGGGGVSGVCGISGDVRSSVVASVGWEPKERWVGCRVNCEGGAASLGSSPPVSSSPSSSSSLSSSE
jgi:hypothetical protein